MIPFLDDVTIDGRVDAKILGLYSNSFRASVFVNPATPLSQDRTYYLSDEDGTLATREWIGTGFLQNQIAAAQTADGWISGRFALGPVTPHAIAQVSITANSGTLYTSTGTGEFPPDMRVYMETATTNGLANLFGSKVRNSANGTLQRMYWGHVPGSGTGPGSTANKFVFGRSTGTAWTETLAIGDTGTLIVGVQNVSASPFGALIVAPGTMTLDSGAVGGLPELRFKNSTQLWSFSVNATKLIIGENATSGIWTMTQGAATTDRRIGMKVAVGDTILNDFHLKGSVFNEQIASADLIGQASGVGLLTAFVDLGGGVSEVRYIAADHATGISPFAMKWRAKDYHFLTDDGAGVYTEQLTITNSKIQLDNLHLWDEQVGLSTTPASMGQAVFASGDAAVTLVVNNLRLSADSRIFVSSYQSLDTDGTTPIFIPAWVESIDIIDDETKTFTIRIDKTLNQSTKVNWVIINANS